MVLYTAEDRATEAARFPMLRQQMARTDDNPHTSLVDFVGETATVGAFAVTAGLGLDALVAEYEAAHDDYSALIAKALADRLAEAFAEALHERARREWGIGEAERLDNDALIAERYRGIRPAFGYPACPDHTEKGTLFALLGAEAIGMSLSERYAMLPAASVSGLYLHHPEARYFLLGKIGRDQVEDYAARKGMAVTEVERWLSPNLGYTP